MNTIPRPDGHHVLTPSASIANAPEVVDFLKTVFRARVVDSYEAPDGSLMHAEVMVGDSVVMLGSPLPGTSPRPTQLSVYVDDAAAVAKTYKSALAAGAKSLSAPTTQPWGYESACVEDTGGNHWTICAIHETLSHDEIVTRMAAMQG